MTFSEMMTTSQKKGVPTFQLEQRHLEKLIDKLNQYLFVKDNSGKFIYVNSNFAKLFGESCEEMRGKSDNDYFADIQAKEFQNIDLEVQKLGVGWEGEETINFPCGGTRVVWVS